MMRYSYLYITDIRHIKGVDNTAADALSRLELDALHEAGVPAIDFRTMANAQSEDTALHNRETSSSPGGSQSYSRCYFDV